MNAIIERNRRAVFHALRNYFTDEATLIRALDVWELRFADQRGFRVNLYVNAVAQLLGLHDSQIRALASHLYAAMTTPENNLPHLPIALRNRQLAVAPQTPPAPPTDISMQTGRLDPRLAVFTNFLSALVDGTVRAQKFDDFLEALDAQTPDIARTTLNARAVWINGGLTQLRQFVNNVPASERRLVVNDIYVAICDACGPVTADRILATAVQATEQTIEARSFSPREFL
jgi:hypothetical protein